MEDYESSPTHERLSTLYSKCHEKEQKLNFGTAHKAKQEIKQILTEEGNRMRQDEIQRQLSEAKEVEAANMEEFNSLIENWDQRIVGYREHKNNLLQEKAQSHAMEMQSLTDRLENQLSMSPKKSSELLNLEKIRDTLAKNKSYNKADKVQTQIDRLNRQETATWHKARAAKIAQAQKNLSEKQENEYTSLRNKVKNSGKELKRMREKEVEHTLQKYQNRKKDIVLD